VRRSALLIVGGLSLAWLACPSSARAGCEKDTDCKGDRICEDGACTDPGGGAKVPKPPERDIAADRRELQVLLGETGCNHAEVLDYGFRCKRGIRALAELEIDGYEYSLVSGTIHWREITELRLKCGSTPGRRIPICVVLATVPAITPGTYRGVVGGCDPRAGHAASPSGSRWGGVG